MGKRQLTEFTQPAAVMPDELAFFGLSALSLDAPQSWLLLKPPWPYQFPGVLAAADHLPHFWLVCPEGKAGWVSPQSGWATLEL